MYIAFSSYEWSATQLHSIGLQKMGGSIQTSGGKFQHIFKKCVANKDKIQLPKTALDPYAVIFVK